MTIETQLLTITENNLREARSRIAALEAENEDIKDQLHYAKGTADVNIKGRLEAEAEIAILQSLVADAETALRTVREFVDRKAYGASTLIEQIIGVDTLRLIDAHFAKYAAQPKDKPYAS